MNATTNKSLRSKIGWSLLLLSGVPWMLMFAIPWLGVPHPIVATGVLYGLSQVLWFIGLWCVGKEVIAHMKRLFWQLPFCRSIAKSWNGALQKHYVQQQVTPVLQSSTVSLPDQDFKHLAVQNIDE